MITENYKDITITYMEDANKWEFTLRGRTRAVDSIKQAREAIDKVPVGKRKFAHFPAYYHRNYADNQFQKVTVTSYQSDDLTTSKYVSLLLQP